MDVEYAVLERVLEPYFSHCRYLRSATVEGSSATGVFSVERSPYVRGTGHLNAADFIVCYNQLAFVFFAQVSCGDESQLAGFCRDQLTEMFIVGMDDVRFRKPVDPGLFGARMDLVQTFERGSVLFADTNFDVDSGKQRARVRVARMVK